jgi:hypothetical protein
LGPSPRRSRVARVITPVVDHPWVSWGTFQLQEPSSARN